MSGEPPPPPEQGDGEAPALDPIAAAILGAPSLPAVEDEEDLPFSQREHLPDERAAPAFSDESLACGFAAQHAHDLRYCEALGSAWFIWEANVWRRDDRRRVYSLARAFLRKKSRKVLASIENPKAAARVAADVASARTVAAVVNLARADERHATGPEEWDADPWALNTPGGIVDLRTGRLKPHDRRLLCSKTTAVAPAEGDAPVFREFLSTVTRGDIALQHFLRRVAGYSLTGVCRDHALFFLWGVGGNGKGVFTRTLSALLDDYAGSAPLDLLAASRNERHPTELALLRGKRLVTVAEARGGRWDEEKIKALTGGDPITARYMRGDFFHFEPTHKLLVAGNRKPSLRYVDEAIRRRLHMLPFNAVIPPEERDQQLFDKLQAEWPQILRWAITGCLEWQAQGLAPPASVTEATADYLADQDRIARWIDDRCVLDARAWASSGGLWTDYKAWAQVTNEWLGTQKAFGQALEDRGFPREKRGDRGYRGLRLRSVAEQAT